MFSEMGIKTAILDMTESKNSYYIYTKNQEELRQIAYTSIEKLEKGIDAGVKVNQNLSVFTDLPGKTKDNNDAQKILSTLAKSYSLVLVDTDFNTNLEYFSLASEIYLVQSLDILTIQPFTAFLRELKTRGILKENIRVVINKYIKCKGLSAKNIIGGLAFYNDPAMTFMHELFNRDTIKDYVIPFEIENYATYIENLVACNISLNGYSKEFMKSLKDLADGVYPLLNGNNTGAMPKGQKYNNYSNNNKFSNDMSNTLEQMKNNY